MKDGKHVVLVVEDEIALLDSYAEILEDGGLAAIKASDGYKGLDQLIKNKDIVDLILLDLMMPGLDGLDVLKQIREDKEKYGEPVVIVLTNLSSERVIKESFERGANGYLMKTELDPDQIVTEVNNVLGGDEDDDSKSGAQE
ncbi:response regulator [Candidatus Dojkabacteria bacterium]|nr:response regulator [Candidatus Dojkabacteria bacterium]